LEREILDIDRTREEIDPLGTTTSSKTADGATDIWSLALSCLYTHPSIDESIIRSLIGRSRVIVANIESFEFQDLDIADTATPCGDRPTRTCNIATCYCIIRIFLDIPAEVGSFFGCLVDEIELEDRP